MPSEDDIFDDFQCDGQFWNENHGNVVFTDAGNIFVGLTRIFAFFVVFGLNWYNRSLLRNRFQENVNVVPGLVLPYYFLYIYLLIVFSIVSGILDIAISSTVERPYHVNSWLISIEQGLFHWLYEGLAFFLMRYGAGYHAMRISLLYSGVWGIFSFLMALICYCCFFGLYSFNQDEDSAFAVFIFYNSLLLTFYTTIYFLPQEYIYRRPALYFYALFNICYYAFNIFTIVLLDSGVMDIVCPGSIITFLLVSFVQPFIIFRTLQIDSQYWQGLKPDKGNPLAEVWDHIDVATAESMAESLEQFSTDRTRGGVRELPIFHFGLLDFDHDEHFVAGGFSRVYFGRCKGERVAFKILFAMELTPDDVKDFYEEALLLASLKHDCIVGCKGICIMPPALTLVLEHCAFGSLYDFLYKPIAVKDPASSSMSWNTRLLGGSSGGGGNGTSKQERSDLLAVIRQSEYQLRDSMVANPLTHSNVQQQNNNNNNNNTQVHFTTPDRSSVASYRSSGISLEENNAQNNLTNNQTPNRNSQYFTSYRHSYRESWRDSFVGGGGGGNATSRQSLSRRMFETLTNLITPAATNSNTNSQGQSRSSLSNQNIVVTAATSLPFPIRVQMMKDAVSGIMFLHSKGFLHCDIKSLNFLVDENYRVKLSDMGEVRAIARNTTQYYAKPPNPARNWAPPEVMGPDMTQLKPDIYTKKSEIYGLCIVLCELITLELPFGDLPDRMIPSQWYDKLTKEQIRPTLPNTLPSQMQDIIERGLSNNQLLRPTAEEIYQAIDDCLLFPGSGHDTVVDALMQQQQQEPSSSEKLV